LRSSCCSGSSRRSREPTGRPITRFR
jgi:hypothetical protein